MKKYKVIALSVVGKQNKVFKHGETVSEANFETGEADKKVKDGFLKCISKEEKTETKAKAKTAKTEAKPEAKVEEKTESKSDKK